MKRLPEIDRNKCNGCGLCVTVCACGALVIVDNVVTVVEIEQECQWCTNCELVCPAGAIACPFDIVFEQAQSERIENSR